MITDEMVEKAARTIKASGQFVTLSAMRAALEAAYPLIAARILEKDQVEWVVNDNAELGVKIGEQFFWLYKGESLVYEDGKHDNGTNLMWRRVYKREFGECCHPINYEDPTRIGTVDINDGAEWKAVPPALSKPNTR